MNNYASATLNNIKHHFAYLHGLLQIAERRITDTLRAQNLESQCIMNATMNKLENYATILQQMHGCVSEYKTTLPNAVNMGSIFQSFYKQIESMPTSVTINQMTNNPFVFTADAQIINYIQNGFIYNCENSNELVKFEYQNIESLPEIDVHHSMCKSKKSFRNENKSQYTLNSFCSNVIDNNVNELMDKHSKDGNGTINNKTVISDIITHSEVSSIRSLSLLTSTTPKSCKFDVTNTEMESIDQYSKQKITAHPGYLELKHNDQVYLSHVNNPESFFLLTEKSRKQIQEISNHYIRRYPRSSSSIQPNDIIIGCIYMAYNKNDNLYYRAVAQDYIENDEYKFFLVDLGIYLHEKISEDFCTNIYNINDEDTLFPYAAVHCGFYNLMPNEQQWTEEAKCLLMQICDNRTVKIIYIKAITNDFYHIDLTAKKIRKIYVRDALLYTGMAHNKGTNKNTNKTRRLAFAYHHLTKLILLPGEIVQVKMVHVNTPSEFYVIQTTMIEERNDICSQLNQVYSNRMELEKIYNGDIKMVCALNINNTWYRASIKKVLRDGKIKVHLADYGWEKIVNWYELYVLSRQFCRKQFLVKCRLADIEPLCSKSSIWSPDAIDQFLQLCLNSNLTAEVVTIHNDVHTIILHMNKNNNDLNIGAQLVKLKLAVSTGVNSQMQSNVLKDDYQAQNVLVHTMISRKLNNKIYQTANHLRDYKTTPVHIVYAANPSEFYVRPISIDNGMSLFNADIQKYAEETTSAILQKECNNLKEWQISMHCLVHALLDNNFEKLNQLSWFRGIITAVYVNGNNIKSYNIFLRDYGCIIENISPGQLIDIPEIFDSVANAARRCNLADLTMPNGNIIWPETVIDYFQIILSQYRLFSVTIISQIGNVFNVILWGMNMIDGDVLSARKLQYDNINSCIAKMGLATYPSSQNIKALDEIFKINFDSVNKWLQEINSNDESLAKMDHCNVKLNHSNENILYDSYLNELDAGATCTTILPNAWLKNKKLYKTIFAAKPTYVDYNGKVYFNYTSDEDFLEKMRNKFLKVYGKIFKDQVFSRNNTIYEVNQPCVAIYHSDNHYYRGIVKKVLPNHEYLVYFIDYGNEEIVQHDHIIPYAPLPKVPCFAICIKIYGIRPRNDSHKYPTAVLDKIHSIIVGQIVSITVEKQATRGSFAQCSIQVGAMNIAEMLIKYKMAERIQLPQCENIDIDTDTDMDCNDNVHNGNTDDAGVLSDSNNLIEAITYPRKRMKPIFEWEDQPETHLANLENNDSSMESENKKFRRNFQTFSGYCFNAVNRLDFNEDLIKKELRNRIYLQYKEKSELMTFFPLDASTEQMQFDGVDKLKAQKLPLGTQNFICTIDSVLTSTELQIFPHITELQKRDVAMMHEIKQLVKTSEPLLMCKPDMFCLACYSRDGNWYRALIRSYNPAACEAVVFYIDYINAETLPLCKLKQMPRELLSWPLRSLHVKLHRLKPQTNKNEHELRSLMYKCLLKQRYLYAIVMDVNFFNDNTSNSSVDISEVQDDLEYTKQVVSLELYENENAVEPVYEELVKSGNYIYE